MFRMIDYDNLIVRGLQRHKPRIPQVFNPYAAGGLFGQY